MPIERREFVSGETHDAVEARVVAFLESHPESAYTGEEVAVAIGHPAGRSLVGSSEVDSAYHILQRIGFLSFLDLLAWQGRIERRHVHTRQRLETFYAARVPPASAPPSPRGSGTP